MSFKKIVFVLNAVEHIPIQYGRASKSSTISTQKNPSSTLSDMTHNNSGHVRSIVIKYMDMHQSQSKHLNNKSS